MISINCRLRYALLVGWVALAPLMLTSAVQGQEVLPHSVGEKTAPAVKLCELLYFSSVRQTLNVSEESFDQLKKAMKPIRDSAPSYEAFRDATFEGRMRTTEPMLDKAQQIDDTIWAILSEILPPEQMQTLMGGHIRWSGVEGLFNRRICQALAIDGDQLEKMIASVNAERTRRRGVLAEVARGKANSKGLPSLILRDEPLLAAAMNTLGESQRKQLQQMLTASTTIVPDVKRFTFGW